MQLIIPDTEMKSMDYMLQKRQYGLLQQDFIRYILTTLGVRNENVELKLGSFFSYWFFFFRAFG